MKRVSLYALVAAVVLLLAFNAVVFAQGATPTPEAMMEDSEDAMMDATATPASMMDDGSMMGATATPAAMMEPSTLPTTGGSNGSSWPVALAAAGGILLVGLGLRRARAAR